MSDAERSLRAARRALRDIARSNDLTDNTRIKLLKKRAEEGLAASRKGLSGP